MPKAEEVPYQRLGQTLNRIRQRIQPTKFASPVFSHHIPVALRIAIPALGYTTLTVSAVAAGRPTRYPDEPALATSERSMANEHLDVAIEDNGTLTLTDRHSGRGIPGCSPSKTAPTSATAGITASPSTIRSSPPPRATLTSRSCRTARC